jgi:hypothetical protein
MGDFGFIAMFVAVGAIWGGFWWWLFWRIARLEAVAKSNWRLLFRGLGLFIGIGLPAMAALAGALHFYT